MILDSLDQLLSRPSDRSLDSLEADVWAKVAAADASDRGFTRLAAVQGAVFLMAIVVSGVAGGVVTSRAVARTVDLEVFSPHPTFAPSSRLMGGHS